MPSHSRTTIRAIEPPPSIRSRQRSESYVSLNRSSLSGPRTSVHSASRSRYSNSHVSEGHSTSLISRSSLHSRRQSLGGLVLPSQAGISLPTSPRNITLPPARRGSKVTVSVTSPVETVHAASRSRRDAPPSTLRRRTTETFIFSPKDEAPMVSSLPPSSRYSSLSSLHSGSSSKLSRSHRQEVTMSPLSHASHRSSRTHRSHSLAMLPSERSSLSSRAASSRGISASTAKASSRHSFQRPTSQFDDLETLAPGDSISQVSGPSRRSRRSFRN